MIQVTAEALSKTQSDALIRIITSLQNEIEARGIALCDNAGNIISSAQQENNIIDNIAALAVGSFAATRELAEIIGEPGFRSISHRGKNSGILIFELNEQYLVVVILGKNSFEGLVRLCLKKTAHQLKTILSESETIADYSFEINEDQEN